MKNKAIFFDRDGVINIDKGYVHKIEDFEFFEDVFEVFKKIPKSYKKIIVTNQAGIAKGIFKEEDYIRLTDWMLKRFEEKGIKIDKVYYCPHHPEGKVKKYIKDCEDRKPNIGMLKKAEKAFNLDLSKCWLIGDKSWDILAGKNAGCRTILINGKTDANPDFETKNLIEAWQIILKH